MTRGGLLALLLVDTVLLAVLELFFLPFRASTIPVPFTVVVAILTTPLLVVQAGRLVHPRAAIATLVLWVLTVVVLGLLGPGGDLVLIQDWRALLLIAGGALPGAFALGGSLALAGRK